MSYSAVNPTQAYDRLSPLTPKVQSPVITTTGRARPNRLCFRRTFSCSSLEDQEKKQRKSTAKVQIPIVINEESTNLNQETEFNKNTNKIKNICTAATTKHNDHISFEEPDVGLTISPKKESKPKVSLPVISVTCEENTNEQQSTCDKSATISLSVEPPPSPSRRTKSVPGALAAGICLSLLPKSKGKNKIS